MRLVARIRDLLSPSRSRSVFLLAFLSAVMAASVVASQAVECSGVVQNGCFEAANDCTSAIEGWMTAGDLSSFVVDDQVRIRDITQEPLPWNYTCWGNLFARIGVPVPPVWQPQSWAALYQDVTVPDGVDSRPELRFRYRIVTHDIKDWSAFRVQVRRADDSMEVLHDVLEDGYVPASGSFGEKNNDLGWKSAAADLSAFKGDTVRLWFQNEHKWDKAVGIWTYLDDVIVFDNQYQIYLPIMTNGFTAEEGFASSAQGVEPLAQDETSQRRPAMRGVAIPRPPTPTPTGG